MKLNQIKPKKGAIKKGWRLGRGPGSGNGTTAGHGNNGQNARAGAHFTIAFEGGQMPLTRSQPKRGFHNIFRIEHQIVNLSEIDRKAAGQSTMDPAKMYSLGLIADPEKPVKILGEGKLSIPVTIQAHAFSASAKEKIIKANGKPEVIPKVKGAAKA